MIADATAMTPPDRVRILKDDDSCPELPIVDEGGTAWAVVWPGVGARLRSMHHIALNPYGRTVELSHPMEAVYYVMGGQGNAIDVSDGSRHELVLGSMAHIDPETRYVFEAGPQGAQIIGGPCPADVRMYAHLGDTRAWHEGLPEKSASARVGMPKSGDRRMER
jgi:hypothetical protein